MSIEPHQSGLVETFDSETAVAPGGVVLSEVLAEVMVEAVKPAGLIVDWEANGFNKELFVSTFRSFCIVADDIWYKQDYVVPIYNIICNYSELNIISKLQGNIGTYKTSIYIFLQSEKIHYCAPFKWWLFTNVLIVLYVNRQNNFKVWRAC